MECIDHGDNAGLLSARVPQRVLMAIAVGLALHAGNARSAEPATPTGDADELDRITVLGRRVNLVGTAVSASEGVIGQADIADRPLLRTGDLLEQVPGLVATQHSGSGKANQYFLRGFNLDHGTDFATFVDGMPVNMRTHGHGQGWTDLNFVIPEAVETITYRKGPYYADVGDFSSAGSARLDIAARVPGRVELTLGEDGYARGLLLGTHAIARGDLLFGVELQAYDGPWSDIDEDVRKRNGLLRFSREAWGGRAHVMAMAYANRWNSPDQIPSRAVASGRIDTFGSLDTTVGGEASRYSLSGGWSGRAFGGQLDANAYAIGSRLDLWSNFTYLLDDPEQGDQFQQVDRRSLFGFDGSQQWDTGRARWRIGVEGRHDDIDRVALLRTRARQQVGTVRDDAVREASLGVFAANEMRWSPQWRSYVGIRHDRYRFDVDSDRAENSGRADAGVTSYKASLAYAPVASVELYASAGTGFHSNDARGTTTRTDPVSGDAVSPVDALVPSRGAELGSRLFLGERLQATVALWTLRLDSELLFVGDAGTTEASRPSAREGIEASVSWFGRGRYSGNLDAGYSRARYRDDDPVGRHVPGSIPLVIGAGITGRYAHGWSGSAQLKHFGRYPLVEDGSVRSEGSTIVNLRAARDFGRFTMHLDVLNALDSRDHDVDYFYASRLAGEPEAGVEDVHFHIFPRRSLRLGLQYRF